jgi:DNA-binding NarL/FixJ family response regulator
MKQTAAQRALVVDAHPLSLDLVERVVTQLDIEVSGRTTKIERVVDLVDEHDPHLLVLGVESVDVDVQEQLRVMQRSHPELRVVVISDEDAHDADAALAAGADVYCNRTASADDLATAIRQSFERSIWLRLPSTAVGAGALHLTRREVQILQLVAEGRTNAEIARTLWVAPRTVKFHLSNIYRKLDVANRMEASRWAARHGLLDFRALGAVTARHGSSE